MAISSIDGDNTQHLLHSLMFSIGPPVRNTLSRFDVYMYDLELPTCCYLIPWHPKFGVSPVRTRRAKKPSTW